jgi:NTP pyrophosphatase (non-canonical NTP hydrolase)
MTLKEESMTQKEYTLNEFQAQCATTAIYGEAIASLLEPVVNIVELCSQHGGSLGEELDSADIIYAQYALDRIRELLNVSYAVMGLAGEAGEVANKMKKVIRDGAPLATLNKEVQGTNWYVMACYSELGINANDAAVQLAGDLQSRKERGVIQGNGDDR